MHYMPCHAMPCHAMMDYGSKPDNGKNMDLKLYVVALAKGPIYPEWQDKSCEMAPLDSHSRLAT
jgi:hypothetical protein